MPGWWDWHTETVSTVDTFTSCHVLATLTLQCANNGQRKRPRPTQPCIPPGSVSEDQLRLGRKRHVWFIPLARMNAGYAGNTVRSLAWERMPYLSALSCVHDDSTRRYTNRHLPYLTSSYRYSIDQPALQDCLHCRPKAGNPSGTGTSVYHFHIFRYMTYCISPRYAMEILALFIHFILPRSALEA